MADHNQNPTSDRRDPMKEGSSLSGSKLRDNISTDKALHPETSRKSEEEDEVFDQDPGERQKENQNQSKDDPLAA
jgi:hypothetical protein